MAIDRTGFDAYQSADLIVRQSFGDQSQHLDLSGGETVLVHTLTSVSKSVYKTIYTQMENPQSRSILIFA